MLSLSSVHDQVLYIERELSRLIGGDRPVMVRLIDEFRPLPHKGSDPADTVEFITPSQCESLISASVETDPKTLTVPLKTPDGLIGYLRLDLAQDFQIPDGFAMNSWQPPAGILPRSLMYPGFTG